ncbi:enoyl-ACP reductase FabI [Anaeromicropila populeti]|uniref:Enoyl-[acyl-carrier-protein] reductase [NADH] n=1 Tax=Anaeromicropila populeti TaxID=37658 RepID=A0A1I6HS29_9FIRM|nr:SDR family oxidoreductase [Anaeromicropila populeti]SFR57281.1 Enoyl-[acyl-carrier-protein] reductase [NADH] [Anaeromicropila populeti]
MKLLEGKCGVITGVVNHRSIAWEIAKVFSENGAQIILTYGNEDRWIFKLASKINAVKVLKCDVTNSEEMKETCEKVQSEFGTIDFFVHSIAYASGNDLKAGVINTSKAGFLKSMEISVFSLIEFCHNFYPFFNNNASVISLSYLGAERVCAGYNLMGIAKSALESANKYLANDLGEKQIRSNVISAGPVRTLAGIGLPNFAEMIEKRAALCPIKQNITQQDVAKTALFLASNLSERITGEVLHVDSGYSVMGTWSEKSSEVK